LINESVSRVQAGSELVTTAGNAMDTIITSVTHVNALMGKYLSLLTSKVAASPRLAWP
jgi:methyl-accepting chemotaxis protein